MALGGLLSLKWNNHCSTFLHILSNLHKKHSYDDATVACDGKLYPVHKLVLSTCSDYFQEMFEKTLGKHPVIVLKDIKSEVFEALLKYMYIGEVNVVQEKLSELINAAECLKIKGLAAPDEEPEQCSHSNRSGHTSSGKRKQDQYHSDNSAPPNKVHRSHSSSGEITKNTSHGISNNSTSSSSSDLNKGRSTASYHHHTSKSSYQDKSIASNNSVENSKRRRSENTSHRSGNTSREMISSVRDDDIEEIPTSHVKQEPVDLGDDPLDEESGRGASEEAEGREEDSMGDRGDASTEVDQPEEQDSKYGILDEDDGGVDKDHWESSLMTKEDEDAEAFSSMLGGDSNNTGGGEGGTAAGQSKVQEDDSAGVRPSGPSSFFTNPRPSGTKNTPAVISSTAILDYLTYQGLGLRQSHPSNPELDARGEGVGGRHARGGVASLMNFSALLSGSSEIKRKRMSHAISGESLRNFLEMPLEATNLEGNGISCATRVGPRNRAPNEASSQVEGYDECSTWEGYEWPESDPTPYPFDLSDVGGEGSGDMATEAPTDSGRSFDDCAQDGMWCCNLCDYRSHTKAMFVVHYRRHTGEKPYKCCFCSYSSTNAPNFNRHMKRHTGVRPFGCPYCPLRGIEKKAVLIHVARKHSDQVCSPEVLLRFSTSMMSPGTSAAQDHLQLL